MADPLLISRLYRFAASADTFTSADLSSAFADEFAGDDVLGTLPFPSRLEHAMRFLVDEKLIESTAPGAFRIGHLVFA